jgi:hypothetical protein
MKAIISCLASLAIQSVSTLGTRQALYAEKVFGSGPAHEAKIKAKIQLERES